MLFAKLKNSSQTIFVALENMTGLLAAYQEHPAVVELLKTIIGPAPTCSSLNGYAGSQISFVLSGAFQAQSSMFVFIARDKEEAAYTQNTLSSLQTDKTIHFFPDSFRFPQRFEELNSTQMLERSELINLLSASPNPKEIIVTYPEALFEKVVAPEILRANQIHLGVREQLDVNFLIEVLIEYDFQRVEFVFEPGQFSIRGGIVDIYSYGNEYPYRIELFDTEIESIRTFDPNTQLSIRNIAMVNIVPNINTRFDKDQKVSLLDILPESTCFWIRDQDFLLDQLQSCFEKAMLFGEKIAYLDHPELKEIFKDRAFLLPQEVIQNLQKRHLILLNQQEGHFKPRQKIELEGKPQPSFNKNFELLIANFKANAEKGIHNYIFTENPKQIERFYAIFRDLQASVQFEPVYHAIDQGFIDPLLKIACYSDHQIFHRYHHYRLRSGYSQDASMTIRLLREMRPGDFVTHIDHGVGRYSGLEKVEINGKVQEMVRLLYKNNDILYVSINSLHKISKYIGKEGTEPMLNKLGSDAWAALKRKTKSKVKDIASELILLYAKRKATKGFAFPEDGYLQNELEASFFYEDTPDQLQSTIDVKEDMQKSYPMDRLICGDVGFGKTEIAIRAAFKAMTAGKQVAVLVPTTILALQHFKTFDQRLAEFGVKVDYLNRFKNAAQKKAIYQDLASGKIDLIIGTHALLNKDVKFKDLGLLVVDEEQKFGVSAKEKLRAIQVNVDTLTLTATPIPRTLQFSLMAARDLTIIRTPPPNRLPIHTEIRVFNDDLIKESIYNEVHRGGQVFFLHNRVKSLPDMAEMIKKLCPDVEVIMVHGQMDPKVLEKSLVDFMEGHYDVLVCTNIIETGLDIPNANTIIINNAHNFGLSDLHQLRGRVGRSDRKAYCYLFCPPLSTLTQESRKRLRTIEEFSDLGSGFDIAMRDLDIRGAGNILGGEQSGFITEIGYDTYQKILEEAIQELKEQDFKELYQEEIAKKREFVRDVQIETDIEMLIPDAYITNIQERLNLYTDLDAIADEAGVIAFEQNLADRFGPVPAQAKELFEGLRLRWICKALGIERLILKQNKMRGYFVNNPQSAYYESAQFNHLMQSVAQLGPRSSTTIKQTQTQLILNIDNINSLHAAKEVLSAFRLP
ncbi:MAG: transcription-repair coupling factor [Saprospiraceae bacterium]